MVKINKLSVRIAGATILNSVTCDLLPKGITTIIGKSGAGKTTLLKSIAGLIAASEGSVIFNETQQLKELSALERSKLIGYVFQHFNLFPHMTVLQNCIDPLRVQGEADNDARDRAYKELQQLEIEDLASKYPSELSGGQQQRVAIARALVLNPLIILFDEPTASLDPYNTKIIVEVMKNLSKGGCAVGVSSQDMSFVRTIFDRIFYMNEGRIVETCEGIEKIGDCPSTSQFVYTK